MTRRGALTLAAAIGASSTFAKPAQAADGPVFPYPGGGRYAIHSYTEGSRAWLLDSVSGRYRELGFWDIAVSPSGLVVAVVHDDGTVPVVGIAGRLALQSRGAAAVRWLGLPNCDVVTFSPDGRAVMTYSVEKNETGVSFTAYRYDLATGRTTATAMAGELPPQWAADSRGYLAGGIDGLDYVAPDGTVRHNFTSEGGMVRQYSPAGNRVLIDPPLPFPDGDPAPWKTAKAVDVATGEIICRIPTAMPDLGVPTSSPLLGWYGNDHVVRYAPDMAVTTIEVVSIFSGAVMKRFPAPGLNPLSYSQLHSTRYLGPAACRAGF